MKLRSKEKRQVGSYPDKPECYPIAPSPFGELRSNRCSQRVGYGDYLAFLNFLHTINNFLLLAIGIPIPAGGIPIP